MIKKIIVRIWMALGVVFTFWLFYSYQAKGVDEKLLQNSRQ